MLEVAVYQDRPHDLGYSTPPLWWPLPWLALAGLLTAFAYLTSEALTAFVDARIGSTPDQAATAPAQA